MALAMIRPTPAPETVEQAEAGAAAPPAPSNLSDPTLYINRELSWLAFNQRVLDQAHDPAHPLLERVKFLAIVANNLDEFFMVRVATLLKKFRAGIEDVSPDGLHTEQQLRAIRQRAAQMLDDMATCWQELLRPQLEAEAVVFLEAGQYTPAVKTYLAGYFKTDIWPVLTPLAFDPGHPFPYISNLSHSLAVVVKHSGRTKFARVKVPDKLPRFVPLPERLCPPGGDDTVCQTFVFLEDVIEQNIQELFPGAQIKSAHLFRIVRDTDMVIQEDEADDLLETVDRSLRQLRYGALSLLQVEASMPRRVLDILVENFEVDEDVVFRTSDRMAVSEWMELTAMHRPALKDAPFVPRQLWAGLDVEAIFDEIRYQDFLVHHPYESFASVESFLRAAVKDPHVLAIKMTLYRIGQDSPLVDLLIEAAEAGKQVAVLVELKARFDERNNIIWANRLEDAGIHVVYGIVHLKTHCKLCMVVRQEQDGLRRYAHVGTGNYNAATSKVYTDLGLFTADSAILDDVSEVFNYLTGYSNKKTYRELLVSPVSMRAGVRALIEREIAHAKAGRPAGLIFKNNAITDTGTIRSLYAASQAGVPVELIVRGVCSLRPGVPGVSDTIHVRSIVGRFLEHSRIYYFENGGTPEVFIGSADLMERNLDRRVEVLCPVRDADICHHLRHVVLDALLRDTDRATRLLADGEYVPAVPEEGEAPMNAQTFLLNHYAQEEL
jgi:polyphosphate kinase